MRIKKAVVPAALTVMSLVLSMTSIFAYLSAEQELDNVFTVGNVEIELEEPGYDSAVPGTHSSIAPDSDIIKDPVITNTGENDALVFVKIRIPSMNIEIADRKTGALLPSEKQDVFEFRVADGWSCIENNKDTDNTENSYTDWVFVYTGESDTAVRLRPGEVTPALFRDSVVHFINMVEGEIDEDTVLKIPVKAYAVQADGLENADDAGAVWKTVTNQTE